MAHLVLGGAARLRGALDEARTLLLSGLDTARTVTYVGEESRLLAELAAVEAEAGNADEATRRARAALALARSGLGDQDTGLRALLVLAQLAAHAGDVDAEQLLLEEAVSARRDHSATDTWRQAVRPPRDRTWPGRATSRPPSSAPLALTVDDGAGSGSRTLLAKVTAAWPRWRSRPVDRPTPSR